MGSRPKAVGRARPRPERFLGPLAATLFLLLAFGAVAHASGSGWVQAIGAVTAGLAVVGILVPCTIAPRLRVTCVECAREGVAGQPYSIEIVANRPLRCTPVRPEGEPVVGRADRPTRITVTPRS